MGERRPIAQAAYDEIANDYADRVDEWPMNAGLERPTMMSLVPEVEGMTVLDARRERTPSGSSRSVPM